MKRLVLFLITLILINTALSTTKVSADTGSNLEGHWEFEGNFNDSSGNGNNGTALNGTTISNGRISQGAVFDGSNDTIQVPDSNSLDLTGQMSISFWVKQYNLNSNNISIVEKSKKDSPGVIPNYAARLNNGYISLNFHNSIWHTFRTDNPVISANTWTHVLINYTNGVGSSAQIYIDGELVPSTWISGNGNVLAQTNAYPLHISGIGSLLPLNGSLDDIRIYSRTLSSSDVSELYQYGKIQISDLQYQKLITIDNSSNPETLTNYQVDVVIDTNALISAGKLMSDCSDIRFLDSDKTTELDYWFDQTECNTTYTKVWVEVPSISNSSSKNIYTVYNQNGTSTIYEDSESNGDNTFIYFNDFSEDPGLVGTNTSNYAYYDASNEDIYFRFGRLSSNPAVDRYFYLPTNTYPTDDISIDMKHRRTGGKITSYGDFHNFLGFYDSSLTSLNFSGLQFYHDYDDISGLGFKTRINNSGTIDFVANTTPYTINLQIDSSNDYRRSDIYQNGSNVYSQEILTSFTPMSEIGAFRIKKNVHHTDGNSSGSRYDGRVDDIRIRKFVKLHPSNSLGSEVSFSQLNQGIISNGTKNAGYYTKVIEKPDGNPLIHYVSEVGNQRSVATAYDGTFISCQNTTCSDTVVTNDPGGYGDGNPISQGIPGAWGLLYYRNSTGLPVYISNNPGNNGRDIRPLYGTDVDFTDATMGSAIYSNTEPLQYLAGVVRDDHTPFIVFENWSFGNIGSISCADDGCTSATYKNLITAGTRPSITKLPDGRPIFSYYKTGGARDLGLYICSNVACTSGSSTTLVSAGDVGKYNSIITRADGTPGIAYSAPDGLRFIDCDDATCSTFTDYSTHDELAVMSGNLSVPMAALDENDNPIILSRAARGRGTGDLSYYICYNPECSEGRFRTLVENEDDVGLYASILRKSDGTLIIPYKDNTNKETELFAGIPSGTSNATNVDASLDLVQVSRQNPLNPVTEEFGDPETQNFSTAVVDMRVQTATGSVPIADFIITHPVNADVDFSSVTGDSEISGPIGRSVINNLTALPETNTTHTLYIPVAGGATAAWICPDATIISEVTLECSNGYELDPERHTVIDVVTIGGNDYFRVLGLTGTGGLGIVGGTPAMRIDLENDAPSASADTEIWFATPTDITANTTIQVSYDIGFTGGSSLTTSDITVTCDGDGLSPISGTGMTTFSLESTSNGFLEINTGTDSCTEWIVIDINGTGGNHLTNPTNPGNYSFSVAYDVGTTGTVDAQGATLAYIQDENDITISAYVPPVLDMELYETNNDSLLNGTGANTCDLGVLSINTVSICTYDIATGTNNFGGVSVYITSDGPLRDGNGNDISACSGINCDGLGGAGVDAGEEEYGIYISDLGGGEYTAAGVFSTQHQAVPTVATLFASSSTTGSGTTTGSINQRLEVTHAVAISLATVQGSYSHIVTYTAFTN